MKGKRPLRTCDECGSEYFSDMSQMAALCPECSHHLYGYPPCDHSFENGRCIKCHWNGSVSDYVAGLKQNHSRKKKMKHP